jgi:two-component system nitrate/nitrite sensor histidine kinase NarX
LGFLNLETDQVRTSLSTGELAEAHAELERMKTAIGTAYHQVRAALVGLRDPLSDTSDLITKLEECLADFRRVAGLSADLIIADPPALQLSRVSQAQALLVVREALTNVRRHAQARHTWVRIDRVDTRVRFSVEDDGCGFDIASVEGNNHLGLAIMRARAERSGGSLSIESTPGHGTTVIVYFPIEALLVVGSGQEGKV